MFSRNQGTKPVYGGSKWQPASTSYGPKAVFGSVYNGSKWAIGGAWGATQWVVSGLSSAAYHVIGNVVNNIWQSQTVQSTQQVKIKTLHRIQSTKEGVENALLKAPPPALQNLDKQLALISGSSDNISVQDVQKLKETLDFLSQDDSKLLKQWAPDLSPEDFEACRLFFQMINNIVLKPEFAAAAANPLLEDLEDQVLQPLMIEDGKTSLNAFSSIIHKITAGHSGYVTRAKDPLMAYKGGTVAGLIFIGTVCVTGDFINATALASLAGFIAADPSVATTPSKALEKGKALIFCAPLLVQSRAQVQQLNKAIKAGKPEKATEAAAALKPLIKEASKNPKAVFTLPLTTREATRLNNLKSLLDGWNENDPLPIEKFQKPVGDALTVFDRKYCAQRGLVEATADAVRLLLTDAKTDMGEVLEEPLNRIKSVEETVTRLVNTLDKRVESVQETVETFVPTLLGLPQEEEERVDPADLDAPSPAPVDLELNLDPPKAPKGKALKACSPLLVDLRTYAGQLQKAIEAKQPEKAKASAVSLKRLLKKAHKNPKAVFTSFTPKEGERLDNLKSILDAWNGNDPLPMEQLKKPVRKALVVLDNEYKKQRPPIAAIADVARDLFTDLKGTAEEFIEEPLNRLDERVQNVTQMLDERAKSFEKTAGNLIKTNLYNALGWDIEEEVNPPAGPADPAAPQAAPVAPPQPAGVASEVDANSQDSFLIQFVEWAASNIAKLIGEKNAGKVSEKSLSAAAGLIALTLNGVASTMDHTSEAHQTVKARINTLISGVNESATRRDWKEMLRLLQDASSIFKGVKAYLGNFRFPIPGTGANLKSEISADAALADNISVLNKAIAAPDTEPEDLDWKALAIEEKDRLVSNAASFLTMKHIYEKVCGLQPINAQFYPQLLADATEMETSADGKTRKVLSEEKLKALFFEQLAAKKVGVVKRVFAELQYWLYATGVKFFAQKATTIYFEEVFNYIENHSKDNFNFVRGMLINNLTRYLTILGIAYKNVANTTSATGLMSEMLMKELEKKESNMGFETEELYKDFAKIVLQKTNGTVFAWFIAKFLGNPEEIVRSVIDMSTGSLQDTNGYTHALNVVIGDQLDLVWDLLQQAQQAPEGDAANLPQEMSEGQKNQLSILVNNLFEILRKSKCSTVDELRNLMDGKLWKENANEAVDSVLIQDIIEQTTRILATTTQSLLQGKQLEKLTYTFAKLINNTFEVAEEVTPAQMQQAEEKVTKRSEQILRFAINTAIKERMDFSGKKQQEETNAFIEELHTLSNKHFDAASADLQTLKEIDVSSADARNKINKLIEATKEYEEKCLDINRQASAAKINTDNREEVNKRNLHLAQQSEPFVKAVGQLKISSKSLEDLQKAIPRLQKIRTIVGEIGKRLYDQKAYAGEEDIAFAEGQMIEFASLLAELKTVDVLNKGEITVIDLYKYRMERLEKILIAQRRALSARLLHSELTQPNSLLERIAQERNTQIERYPGKPASQENLNLMRQKLMVISNEVLLPQMHQQLEAIEKASSTSQVDTAKAELLRLLNSAVSEANQKILSGRDEHWACSQEIDEIARNTHLLEPQKIEDAKSAIQKSVADAQKHLGELKTWEKDNYKKVIYGNFSTGSSTKWIQDIASEMSSDFVYGRVKERKEGILNLLKREETYRYGILHHSFLIPYVQRVKKSGK